VGDANLSEVATFLKVGTTALVLAMIEDEFLSRDVMPAAPVAALRKVSYDMSLRQPIDLADGTTMTAVEMQWEYLDRAKKYAEEHGLECLGATEIGDEVLRQWEHVLTALETDPMSLSHQLDWVAKYRVVDGYRTKHGLRWDDAKLRAMDLQYHDLRPARSLASRVGLQRLTTDDEVARAVTEPPSDTRAWFRGKCLQRWASQIVAANWDSMVFDIGGDPLRRVPMMDPTRGTEAHVGRLMAESTTSAELLDRLGQ
jgi:proteasome accessory factor A